MPTLFIRLESEPVVTDAGPTVERLSWAVLDGEQCRSAGRGSLSTLPEILDVEGEWTQRPANVVLLAPTAFFFALACDVPGRSAGQIRRALPYVVEEYLAVDVDRVHLAHGPIRRGEPVAAITVDRGLLEGWIEALARVGITAGALYPEAALLPLDEVAVSLFVDGDLVLARSRGLLLECDRDSVTLLVPDVLERADPGAEVLRVAVINESLEPLERAEIENAAGRYVEWVDEEVDRVRLEYLARQHLRAPPPVNVLQGEFAPPRESSAVWLRYRSVAALAAILFVVVLAAEVVRGVWSDIRADQLREETEALFTSVFPNERLRDPYRQMRGLLGASRSDGIAFVPLLGRLATDLKALDASATMRSINYSDERGELAAELTLSGFDALDELKARLDDDGLTVEISSAEQEAERIRARVRVRAG